MGDRAIRNGLKPLPLPEGALAVKIKLGHWGVLLLALGL